MSVFLCIQTHPTQDTENTGSEEFDVCQSEKLQLYLPCYLPCATCCETTEEQPNLQPN